MRVLDVAGGTGDIAFRVVQAMTASRFFFPLLRDTDSSILATSQTAMTPTNQTHTRMSPFAASQVLSTDGTVPPSSVVVCDINPAMLTVGRDRARHLGLLAEQKRKFTFHTMRKLVYFNMLYIQNLLSSLWKEMRRIYLFQMPHSMHTPLPLEFVTAHTLIEFFNKLIVC
jgi:hypothetical protein